MRLINADVLIEALNLAEWFNIADFNEAIYTVKKARPVDAVPVVRCKDCRFSDWYTAVDGKRYCYCMETGASGRNENDFCSYGVKDGDHHEG